MPLWSTFLCFVHLYRCTSQKVNFAVFFEFHFLTFAAITGRTYDFCDDSPRLQSSWKGDKNIYDATLIEISVLHIVVAI